MPLSLKQLRYFVAIADAGALSRAAGTLSIAQSALSHHVGEMETTLGVMLLERGARGISLTMAGKRLYEHAGVILKAIEKAEQDVRTVANMASGPISVGLCHTAVEVVSLAVMQATRAYWPDIHLTIVEGLSANLIDRTLSGELDFAVAYNPPPERRLHVTPMLEERLYLVGTAAIIGSGQAPVAFADIPSGQVLGMNRFSSSRSILNSQHLRDLHSPDIMLELDSLSAMRKALVAGLGCSILAKATVGELIASGAIHARAIVEPEISRQLAIVSLSDRPQNLASREMATILKNVLIDAVRDGQWAAQLIEHGQPSAI